jgi:hypothetical protein
MAQHGVALLAIAKVTDDEERREANIRDAVRILSSAVNARDKIRPGSYFDLFVKSLGEDNIRYFNELAVAGPDEQISMLNYPIGMCLSCCDSRSSSLASRRDLYHFPCGIEAWQQQYRKQTRCQGISDCKT